MILPDNLDYSSDEHVQPEFTVVLDENLCETLVVGEGDDWQDFVVIHKRHTQKKGRRGKSQRLKGWRGKSNRLKDCPVSKTRERSTVWCFQPQSQGIASQGSNVIWCGVICKKCTSHLKKHFLKHHVVRRYWLLNPKAYQKCLWHEIDFHVRKHGLFCIRRHMSRFAKLLSGFLKDIKKKLWLSSDHKLLRFIKEKHLSLVKTKRSNCTAHKRV